MRSTQVYDSALHLMEVQGGSFVRALVDCYYAADPPNRRKLREAFSEYFNEYERRFLIWQEESKEQA